MYTRCVLVTGVKTCVLPIWPGVYARLATTIDDASGEAFDKTAKLLGLGYPGGPAVEKAAAKGDPKAVPLPRPLVGTAEPHFCFAGLKSAVMRAAQSGRDSTQDIPPSFQPAVIATSAARRVGEEGVS